MRNLRCASRVRGSQHDRPFLPLDAREQARVHRRGARGLCIEFSISHPCTCCCSLHNVSFVASCSSSTRGTGLIACSACWRRRTGIPWRSTVLQVCYLPRWRCRLRKKYYSNLRCLARQGVVVRVVHFGWEGMHTKVRNQQLRSCPSIGDIGHGGWLQCDCF